MHGLKGLNLPGKLSAGFNGPLKHQLCALHSWAGALDISSFTAEGCALRSTGHVVAQAVGLKSSRSIFRHRPNLCKNVTSSLVPLLCGMRVGENLWTKAQAGDWFSPTFWLRLRCSLYRIFPSSQQK